MMEIELCNERLLLLPEKAIYWPDQKALLISDIHLGKIDHFRKAGIAVPEDAGLANYMVLQDLINQFDLKTIYILGDLFHSEYNVDWERFDEFIEGFTEISFELIMGNHDILHPSQYERTRLVIHNDHLKVGPFYLSHHPTIVSEYYNLCGHIHPCIKLRGRSRQYLRLPCFYFGEMGGILPAIGSFTGLHPIKKGSTDDVYAIADGQIVKID